MDEKLPPTSLPQEEAQVQRESDTRRTFLMKMGLALNGLVAVGLTVPLVRYLFSAVGGKKDYLRWTAIGDVNDFRDGETALISFRNPLSEAMGRANVENSGLRTPRDRITIHSLCHKLRAPGMPGAVVS